MSGDESRLAATDLGGDARRAWHAGVDAACPRAAVTRLLDRRPEITPSLADSLVVATGKAAVGMSAGLGATARGFALLPVGSDDDGVPDGVEVLRGGHPVPSAEGFAASRHILAAVGRLGRDDRLLYLVSGGTSSLFEVPHASIPDPDALTAYRLLLGSGAAIDELNLVRRALSVVKGGGLARAAHPASVRTLALSDVDSDDPGVIGSGPTVPTEDEPGAAARVLERYGLASRMPNSVRDFLARESGRAPAPVRIEGYEVVGSIGTATTGARARLREQAYELPSEDEPRLAGTSEDAADRVTERITQLLGRGRRAALVMGGETTVRLPRKPGRGGRNQHLAASIALRLAGRRGFACVVAGTDGVDGLSDAAGSLVDGSTAARARAAGLPLEDALREFDTTPALDAAGASLRTGATGTNVGDLVVATVDPATAGRGGGGPPNDAQ